MRPWRIAPRARRGFTLIELLVVIAIAMTLMTISVWAVARAGKRDELEAVTNAVKALLRRARNAAREERAPARVDFDLDEHEVRATTRETLALFRFEDEQLRGKPASFLDPDDKGYQKWIPEYDVVGSFNIVGHVFGADWTADGKLGGCLDFERPGAYVSIERDTLSPIEGVAVEAWVRPASFDDVLPKNPVVDSNEKVKLRMKAAGTPPCPAPVRSQDARRRHPEDPLLFCVARKGKAYEVAVTSDYAVQIAVTGKNKSGNEVTYVARTVDSVLRAGKWARIQLAFDGREAMCSVDGIRKGLDPVKSFEEVPVRLVNDVSPLVISDPDPDRCFIGKIDEVKIQGIIRGEHVPVPRDVAILAPQAEVFFDALGQLDPLRHAEPVVVWFSDADSARAALEPPPPDGKTRSKTKAQIEAEKQHFDQKKAERYAALVKTLQDGQVRTVTVELTGAVGTVKQ